MRTSCMSLVEVVIQFWLQNKGKELLYPLSSSFLLVPSLPDLSSSLPPFLLHPLLCPYPLSCSTLTLYVSTSLTIINSWYAFGLNQHGQLGTDGGKGEAIAEEEEGGQKKEGREGQSERRQKRDAPNALGPLRRQREKRIKKVFAGGWTTSILFDHGTSSHLPSSLLPTSLSLPSPLHQYTENVWVEINIFSSTSSTT